MDRLPRRGRSDHRDGGSRMRWSDARRKRFRRGDAGAHLRSSKGLGARSSELAAAQTMPPQLVPEFRAPSPVTVATLLASAFSTSEPSERLRLCREAAALDAECEVAQLALASACRENARRRRRARGARSRGGARARLGSGRLRERQAVAGLRRPGARARRVPARRRPDAVLLRRVQQSRRDARRARRSRVRAARVPPGAGVRPPRLHNS